MKKVWAGFSSLVAFVVLVVACFMVFTGTNVYLGPAGTWIVQDDSTVILASGRGDYGIGTKFIQLENGAMIEEATDGTITITGATGFLVTADSVSMIAHLRADLLKNADSTTTRTYTLSLALKNADSTTMKNGIAATYLPIDLGTTYSKLDTFSVQGTIDTVVWSGVATTNYIVAQQNSTAVDTVDAMSVKAGTDTVFVYRKANGKTNCPYKLVRFK